MTTAPTLLCTLLFGATFVGESREGDFIMELQTYLIV